jgi:DNA-binding NarL/FixJ family response regulator
MADPVPSEGGFDQRGGVAGPGKGRTALSADIDHELALSRLDNEPSAIDVLSPREFEVLRMLLAGRTPEEIAETLHVSLKTVANTRYLTKSKLGVNSDIELMRLALRQGLLSMPEIDAG